MSTEVGKPGCCICLKTPIIEGVMIDDGVITVCRQCWMSLKPSTRMMAFHLFASNNRGGLGLRELVGRLNSALDVAMQESEEQRRFRMPWNN